MSTDVTRFIPARALKGVFVEAEIYANTSFTILMANLIHWKFHLFIGPFASMTVNHLTAVNSVMALVDNQPSPPSALQSLISTQNLAYYFSFPLINFSHHCSPPIALGVTTQSLSVTNDTIMSHNSTRSGRLRPLAKRLKVEEDDELENKDAVAIITLETAKVNLENENEALKKRLKEAQKAISMANEARDAANAKNDELKNAQQQMKAEIESMLLKEKTRQKNLLELVQKHNCEVRIRITGHAQVKDDFSPLVASGNKRHINNLLDYVLFTKAGEWHCFQQVCEKGPKGLCQVHASRCPIHGSKCSRVIVMKLEDDPLPHEIIFSKLL
jgi:hypothetical protein